jgi:hypothetical protein
MVKPGIKSGQQAANKEQAEYPWLVESNHSANFLVTEGNLVFKPSMLLRNSIIK